MTTLPSTVVSQAFHFKYNNDRFVKRSGGFIQICSATNCKTVFSQEIYDTVIYNSNNTIEVITKSTDPIFYPMRPDTTIYTILNNRPQSKIRYNPTSNYYDTTLFYYSSNQKLERTLERSKGAVYEQLYTYNTSGNLEKVTGRITSLFTGTLLYISEERLGNYDSTRNPLKGYWLWDQCLYGSLSENNFRTYTYYKTDVQTGGIIQTASKNLILYYDSNGIVDFSK